MPPRTFRGEDLKLVDGAMDHIHTEHGGDTTQTMAYGGTRKSKWLGDETKIEAWVMAAFDSYRQSVKSVNVTTDANGRIAANVNLGQTVGTGNDGNTTTRVRIVLEVKHSGDATVITAFPL